MTLDDQERPLHKRNVLEHEFFRAQQANMNEDRVTDPQATTSGKNVAHRL